MAQNLSIQLKSSLWGKVRKPGLCSTSYPFKDAVKPINETKRLICDIYRTLTFVKDGISTEYLTLCWFSVLIIEFRILDNYCSYLHPIPPPLLCRCSERTYKIFNSSLDSVVLPSEMFLEIYIKMQRIVFPSTIHSYFSHKDH